MAAVTWSHAAQVPASPEAVFEWMTDFREDDHSRPAFRRGAGIPEGDAAVSVRRVVAREGDTVTLEDTWGRRKFHLKVALDAARRELRIDGGHGYAAVWRARPDGAGTRLEVEGRMDPGGLFGLLLPLFRKRMLAEMERDFRGHVADLEESISRGGPARGPGGSGAAASPAGGPA